MSAVDNFLKVFDKLPKEQQQKAIPLLKRVGAIIDNNNEIVKRKYEFNAQFTTVVGVVFGVLAAFNNIGQNKSADIVYMIGLVCCGLCLILCVIGLYQPIHNESIKKDNNTIKALNELIVVFTPDKAETDKSESEAVQLDEIKPSNAFKWIRICSHILFAISIICMITKIIIEYILAY